MIRDSLFSLGLVLILSGTSLVAAPSQERLEAEVQDLKESLVAVEMMLKAHGLTVVIPQKECSAGRVVINSKKGGRTGVEFIESPFLETFVGTGKSFASARIEAMAKCDSYLRQLEQSGLKAVLSERGFCKPIIDAPEIADSDCRKIER